MANQKSYEDFFDIEKVVEAEEEEEELTFQGLQELVEDLLNRVAKLERNHAKF